MIDLSVALGRVICVADPAEAAARDARMIARGARADGAARRRRCRRSARAASPRARPRRASSSCRTACDTAGATGRFDDVVGRGFALVSPARRSGARRSTPSSRAFFASLGGVTAHVAARRAGRRPRRRLRALVREHGVAVALLRPDFAVFGTARELAGANALLRELHVQLADAAG